MSALLRHWHRDGEQFVPLTARVQATIIRAMDEPEPLPAFTFSPDGPATITYPDGTVSVNAPRPGEPVVMPTSADVPGASEPQTWGAAPAGLQGAAEPQAGGSPSADEPGVAESPTWAAPAADAQVGSEPQAGGTAPVAAPATTLQAWGAPTATAGADASGSVVNPDGSITTRLPDGSTQTVARLPGGATIVIRTTRPGEDPQPPPAEPQRSRRWRGRSK